MAEAFAARPLQAAPFALAHVVSPNSFFGFHVLLMAAFAVRVIGGAYIGFFLFRSRTYAAATGLLFLLFPADTQQLAFRTINVSCSVALMCAGIAVALHAVTVKRSSDRWKFVILSIILSVIAVLIYEPVFALYPVVPLLIWARYGIRASLLLFQHRRRFIIGWFIAPVVNIAYLYYAMVIFGSTYQSTASNGSIVRSIIGNWRYLFDSLAYRIFYDAWVSSLWIVGTQIVHFKFIVVSGAALTALLLMLSRNEKTTQRRRLYLRVLVSGLIAAVAGYAPYMVDVSHMLITQRTFINVAPGATIVLMAAIAYLARRRLVIGAAVASAFIFVSMVAQLYQFDQYTRDYTGATLPFMSFVADKVDHKKPVHLVIDSSGFGGHLTGMYMTKVSSGMPVRTGDATDTYLLCMDRPASPSLPFYNCTLSDGVWTASLNGAVAARYPESSVQTIAVDKSLLSSYRSLSSTWRDEGSFSANKSMFKAEGTEMYSCVADSMWGYSGFCRGEGWSDGIVNHDSFQLKNFFGAIAPTASLIFDLRPIQKNYSLKIVVYGGLDGVIIPAMKISVNRVPVSYKATGPLELSAEIPASILINGQNEIQFDNVLPSDRQIGLLVSRIDLAPVP